MKTIYPDHHYNSVDSWMLYIKKELEATRKKLNAMGEKGRYDMLRKNKKNNN